MRAGRLRTQASFERQSSTVNALGERLESWSAICSRFIAIDPASGRESFGDAGEAAEDTLRLRLRYDGATASITPADRVVISGVKMNIRSIQNVGAMNAELLMVVTRNDRSN